MSFSVNKNSALKNASSGVKANELFSKNSMKTDAIKTNLQVSALMLPDMLLSSIAMPLEMLHAASAVWHAQSRQRSHCVLTKVGAEPEVQAFGGLTQTTNLNWESREHADLVIVPALWRNPMKTKVDNKSLAWLQHQHQSGTIIMAIGTGVWLPARAELLNHQPATTHWHALESFAKQFPSVQLQRDHMLTQAGQIFCAASINSGADLMVHIIALLYGNRVAQQVEQQFSPEVRAPFDKRVFRMGAQQHSDELIAVAQSWLHQRWQLPLSLAGLAQAAGLSERQTQRRFTVATGLTPQQYQQKLRCEYALEWLHNSNLSIAEISQMCGFSDASHCSRSFKRWFGVTPSESRLQVKKKLFSVSNV
ncbi:MAG: helix-turn-helix domain-containing protein [Oleibacter sp.]|nr:helix-turn-helix domain-containing protein [Thalassolituus sp.]